MLIRYLSPREDSYRAVGPYVARATPRPYVTAASRTPTMVISAPLAYQLRFVTSDLAAPTAKWARVAMMNDAITAGIPTVKKNGMMGMNPPIAVDNPAESAERQGS